MVLSGLMYARMSGNTQAVHRTVGGFSLRAFNLTRDLLLLGSLLALLLRIGAGAG
jgi:hypothetical protein